MGPLMGPLKSMGPGVIGPLPPSPLEALGGSFHFQTTGIPILYVELRCERAFSELYMAVSFVDVTKFACESLEF